MNSSNFSTGSLIIGVLIGAVAGLAAGILLAPDKGTETRKKLKEKGNELADNVKNKFSGYVEKSKARLDEAVNKVDEWTGKKTEENAERNTRQG